MPEAELPGNQHLPDKKDPVKGKQLDYNQSLDNTKTPLGPKAKTSASEVDDAWETVDFPNAISVDSIPVLETAKGEPTQEVEKFTSPSLSRSREIESENIMEALHECNRELVNRVTELEAALEECQKTLENQERLLEERTQELASTQQQVTRLFYKLELCNQIIQRQEVLVESLTDKWEQSQQHQAQMERECALTQQSYNDQSYHLKQLENSCQELRSRLYRQQRQTLQFKTALERCLEMPGRMELVDAPEVEITLAEKYPVTEVKVSSQKQPPRDENAFDNPNLQSQPLPLVNSQPVRPWSPPRKPIEEKETISTKSEETIAKMSFGKKLDLPQVLEMPEPETASDQNSTPEDLSDDFGKNPLNPSLPSFARIAEVPTYDLEESEQVLLGEIEAAEYVVTENDLAKSQNLQQDQEIRAESHTIEESREEDAFEYDRVETNIQTKRISWNISTGNWNVSKDEIEAEPEIDAEDFPEVADRLQQDVEQTTTTSKLHLPTWNPPTVDPIVSVSPQKQRQSLAAIDLPTFPKIPIDDQPSVVGG